MKKHLKAAALLLAAVMILALLTGCVDTELKVRFEDDGSVCYTLGSYVAQSFFDATSTTPQEMYKDKLADGKELMAVKYGSEIYWGLEPETVIYDSLEEFKEAMEENSSLTVETANPGSGVQYANLILTIPSKAKIKEENNVESDPYGLADKLIYVFRAHFPGGIMEYGGSYAVTISEDRKDAEAVLYPMEDEYTFHVAGNLSDNYVTYAMLYPGEIEAGMAPADVSMRVKTRKTEEQVDPGRAEAYWYERTGSDALRVMEKGEVFEPGRAYTLYYKLPVKYPYFVSNDISCFVNDVSNKDKYIGADGKHTIVFRMDYEALPKAETPETPEVPVNPAPWEVPVITGPSVPELTTPFTDVSKDDYYYDAVVWAYNAEPQVTDGNGKDKLMPDQTCTRGQVVTFLYRALNYPLIYSGNNPFKDVNTFNYFYKPVLWAYSTPNRVTDGTSATTFSPDKECTNAQILTFVWRAMGRPDDKGSENTADYWKDAYDWAESKGMLKDTGICLSNINEPCPRKNVVQLLYLYNSMK